MHLKALFEFLSGLEQNNNRPWFAWNKPAYDVLRGEFEAAGRRCHGTDTEIRPRARPGRPQESDVPHLPRHPLFQDKTPYKTHFSAAIRDRSKRGLEPGYYFHIDHKGMLLVGGGIYRPEPEILKRLRRYIAARPGTLTTNAAQSPFQEDLRRLY